MPGEQEISTHYTHGDLTAAIRSGIEKLGKTIDFVTVDDLAPVDEFTSAAARPPSTFSTNSGSRPTTASSMSDAVLADRRGL